MKINGRHYRSLWEENTDGKIVIKAIDQRLLPFQFEIATLENYIELIDAIKTMLVRGAPLIGIAGAYAVVLALQELQSKKRTLEEIKEIAIEISSARPTAINLTWAVDRVLSKLDFSSTLQENFHRALAATRKIYSDELASCEKISSYGYELLLELFKNKRRPINILTHCNAGWLATVDWGTALSPIYRAWMEGLPLHVWVDETRPRNQGSFLTSFELLGEGIPHTVIVDNAGGLLMQMGKVDAVIVGADRVTSNGDVCNKIGTYLKALAAREHNIQFWVAFPTSTIDLSLDDFAQIPIELRSSDEINFIEGLAIDGNRIKVRITPQDAKSLNYAFDITPAKFISAYITELGVFENFQQLKSNLNF